jgi:serpin B
MVSTIFSLLLCAAAQEPVPGEKEFCSRALDFSFKVHDAVVSSSKGKNVFLSPTSMLLALGMAASGARGETRDEMVRALSLEGWNREEIDSCIGALLGRWTAPDDKVRLEIANSLWSDKDCGFAADYVRGLKKWYRAEATSVNMRDSATADLINQWASDHTAGKIPAIVERPIRDGTVLFLINAVYFKGEWTKTFDPAASAPKVFHLADGKPVLPVFMKQKGRFNYLDTHEFRAVRIPYGAKGRVGFYIVLPAEAKAGDGGLPKLTAALWTKWKGSFESREGTVEFPKFRTGSELDLIPVLRGLGMKKAFATDADFSGMTGAGGGLAIQSVLHKTFVDVNEKGTEAAAVTAIRMGITSAPPPPFVFVADRPFFCAIVDDVTNTMLFTGWIADPR